MTHFIQLHIGDFLGDTMEMDHSEVGAYWLMLVAHYKNGLQGIPSDPEKLKRICKITDRRAWHKIKDTLLSKFTEKDGWLIHERVLKELSKHKSNETKVSELNTDLRDKSVQTCPDKSLKTKEVENHNLNHITNNLKKEKNTKKTKKDFSEKFEKFWEQYPRHRRGNKDNAWKAWLKALEEDRASEDEIIRGCVSYARSNPGEFAKGAAAWLNDDRWTWQTTDHAVKIAEQKQDWPPWKKTFAEIIGEKSVHAWFQNCFFADGVLTVKTPLQEARIRENYSEQLRRIGLEEIRR